MRSLLCVPPFTRLALAKRLGGLLLVFGVAVGQAADFRSLRESTAARLDPQAEAAIAFYYRPGTPVEVIQVRDGWAQVRDAEGEGLFWIPATALSPQRTVLVRHDQVAARSAPDPTAAILLLLPKNAVLLLQDAAIPGWVAVDTPKGPAFIAKGDVWGW